MCVLYIYICVFFTYCIFCFCHSSINRFISSHIFISSRRGVRPGFQPMKNCLITWRARATTTRTATCHWISSGIILPNIWGIMNTVKKNCDSINLVEGNIFAGTPNQFDGKNHGFRWRFSQENQSIEPGVKLTKDRWKSWTSYQNQMNVWRNGEMWSVFDLKMLIHLSQQLDNLWMIKHA